MGGAFKEDFWSTEAACSCTIGASRRTCIGLWISGGSACHSGGGGADAFLTFAFREGAHAGFGVCAFTFSKSKIDEDAAFLGWFVEEVGGFDVAVENAFLVDCCQGSEDGAEVDLAVCNGHLAEVFPEIGMLEIWQHSNDLVGAAHGGDEWADGGAISQVFEKVELVEDAGGRGCDVDLLDCDDPWATTTLCWQAIGTWCGPAVLGDALLLVDVPSVVVVVVAEVFGFVDGGECA